MNELGVYINSGLWSFPTIFSIGDADTTTPNLTCLVGVSKTGDALEYSDGTTTLSWPVPNNLVGRFAHVALVFNQASGVTAYLDGRSLGTQAPLPQWAAVHQPGSGPRGVIPIPLAGPCGVGQSMSSPFTPMRSRPTQLMLTTQCWFTARTALRDPRAAKSGDHLRRCRE